MKLKNASFVELHLEKVVIGTAVVLSLVFILLFVVRRPTVEINGKKVGPAEVDEQVLGFAKQLQQKLQSDEGIVDPTTGRPLEIMASSLSDDFQRLAQLTRSWQESTAVTFGIEGEPIEGYTPEYPYAIPTPPLPTEMVVGLNAGTLELYQQPEIEEAYADLYQWEVGEPRDIVGGVTVSAIFDPAVWKQRLDTVTGGTKMSNAMSRQAQRIAGVLLLRQRKDHDTGEWVQTTVVDTAPEQIGYGAYALRDAAGIAGERFDPEVIAFEDARAREISGSLVIQKIAVTQSPEPRLSKGVWRMPGGEGSKELTEDDYTKIDKIRADIVKRQKNLELLESQLEQHERRAQLQAQRDSRSANSRSGRGGQRGGGVSDFGPSGGADGFDGMAGGFGDTGGRGGSRSRGTPQDKGQELQQRIQQTELDIDTKFNEVMVLLGWQIEQDDPRMMFGPLAQDEQVERVVVGPGTQAVVDAKIDIWAHDLTVVPGNIYRYKIVAMPLNPLFRNLRVPEPQKSMNFNRIAIAPSKAELEEMPWSQEVVVNDSKYFFYTGGSASQQTARFEVWRFYDGQWRVGEIEALQGDQVAGKIEYELDPDPADRMNQRFADGRRPQAKVIQVFQLPVDTESIFLELSEATVEATGRQISNVRYLGSDAQLASRTLEDDRLALQRRKLWSLEWLASEPMLQQGAAGMNRGGMPGDFNDFDPGMMGFDDFGGDFEF